MRLLAVSLVISAELALTASAQTAPELAYSTYLRDSFTPAAIAADAAGNIYLAGTAIVDAGTGQSTGLLVKLNPRASEYLYVRYWGGSVRDQVNAIAVDSAGNVYIAGQTASPDFPVTTGGNLGTPSTGIDDRRSFVAKFDNNGVVVYSDLIGGSAQSYVQALAATAAGQLVVSGFTNSKGFPTTTGAYAVPSSANQAYLLELDPTGTQVIFSGTGIGGSALALDASGNIYIAGSTGLLNYPTTPGAYQTTFPVVQGCFSAVCEFVEQGPNQYVTKVDSTGSKLIYSTAVTGSGNTSNGGLAVDAAGNVYVTGYAGAGYPYTVTPPSIPTAPLSTIASLPFLTKLDPSGATVLFSVPVGGTGVQLDSAGNAYVGGRVGGQPGLVGSFYIGASLRALTGVPAPCLPAANANIGDAAYVSQVNAATGDVLGTQFIGGATIVPSGAALVGSTAWIAGATNDPDVPFTPNALTLPLWFATPGAGAYVGAVDFSQPAPAAGAPQIGCVLDAADLSSSGPENQYQLLSVFGSGLGPSTPVSATDNSTTSLGGVSITFPPAGSAGVPAAILLYVSSTQINFAAPLIQSASTVFPQMLLTVNSLTARLREFPLNDGNPHVFLNFSETPPSTLAFNADGTVNSAANPAAAGSMVSILVNGITPDPQVTNGPFDFSAEYGWTITNVTQPNPFLLEIDARLPPASMIGEGPGSGCTVALCTEALTVLDGGQASFGGTVYAVK